MIQVRAASDRGVAQFDWLDSRHSFSFGNYYDPAHMSFGVLRVINEDKIQPGKGFGLHSHQDMEILTYVLAGALEHQDSLGNRSVIRAGDVQRMTAGTGIRHSEFNASTQEPVHLLQIWIVPDTVGLQPSYEEIHLQETVAPQESKPLRLIGSRQGQDGAVILHQDVKLYLARLKAQEEVSYQIQPGRSLWLQVAQGSLQVNDRPLTAGDGAGITAVEEITLTGLSERAEVLIFDLPLS
ncbi:MAG: pirin family protein [Prochlorotrichaceae cyanobacterium]|jgi:redox-sensitive bicupin YhaK (pirin superfamily)